MVGGVGLGLNGRKQAEARTVYTARFGDCEISRDPYKVGGGNAEACIYHVRCSSALRV